MKVISGLARRRHIFRSPVLAIGVFDGVHRGHQSLIRKVVSRARALNGTSVVMTFHPHPVHFLRPGQPLVLLSSLEQRLELIGDLGVDVCIVINFNRRFSQLTPQIFMDRFILKAINPREIFVGQNFRFGKSREGDVQLMSSWGNDQGIHVHPLETLKMRNHTVSSSYVRQLIQQGRASTAARLLGRNVSCHGRVIKGDGRGRRLGFPTANIMSEHPILLPSGVYQVCAVIDGKSWPAMANIGYRPSFYKSKASVNLEAHIFDFHKNIYNREIDIHFLKRIRPERAFPSPSALSAQLKKDRAKVRSLFQN